MPREYDKLVRDEVPAVVEANGETPVVHVADGEEYERRLYEKLDEEVAEFRESGAVDELADVFEVVHAIREATGVSEDAVREARDRKAESRGRFRDGVVLERVEE